VTRAGEATCESAMTRWRRVAAVAAAAALVLAFAMASASPAVAADSVFGIASASSRYGDAINLEQTATIPAGVVRVEAVVREGIGAPTFLAPITQPPAGPTTLRYRLDTPTGTVFPNTPVELGFRLTFEDGHTLDSPTTTHLYADDRYAWKTLVGSVVRVHWTEGDAAFGHKLLDVGEQAIRNATSLLGVDETTPIDFYVYGDRDAFYDVIGKGLQENVGGLALPEIRTLFANIGSSNADDPWVSIVVPHELTHIVFGTATQNAYHEPLHWLNEGLAVYLAQGYDAGARANVNGSARSGDLMPLSALVQQFPASADRFSLAYDEAVSAIDFMVRTYGRDALVKLIRSYADGVSDDAAFKAALGVDTKGFEAAWLADLGIKAPVPFGPAAAPVGPLPPGWVAAPGQTGQPGSIATLRPGGAHGSTGADDGSGVVWVVVAVFAIVLVAGLLFVARGLSRGNPLMPTGAVDSTQPHEQPREPDPPEPAGQ
jgi:Peptidase MA superfamily